MLHYNFRIGLDNYNIKFSHLLDDEKGNTEVIDLVEVNVTTEEELHGLMKHGQRRRHGT